MAEPEQIYGLNDSFWGADWATFEYDISNFYEYVTESHQRIHILLDQSRYNEALSFLSGDVFYMFTRVVDLFVGELRRKTFPLLVGGYPYTTPYIGLHETFGYPWPIAKPVSQLDFITLMSRVAEKQITLYVKYHDYFRTFAWNEEPR